MGAASSKAKRELPTKLSPSWAGQRTDGPVHAAARRIPPLATEKKDSTIERDAKDPHFMKNLAQLGQVKVDHHMATYRTADPRMSNILRTQKLSEQQASSYDSTRNRLLASSLFELLEQRNKSVVSTREDLARLATRFDMDVDVLERLGRTVNSPSPVSGSMKKVVNEDGEERITYLAEWVDPLYAAKKPTKEQGPS